VTAPSKGWRTRRPCRLAALLSPASMYCLLEFVRCLMRYVLFIIITVYSCIVYHYYSPRIQVLFIIITVFMYCLSLLLTTYSRRHFPGRHTPSLPHLHILTLLQQAIGLEIIGARGWLCRLRGCSCAALARLASDYLTRHSNSDKQSFQ
jgi:hypothetical protein